MVNIERNGLIGWLSVGLFYSLLFEKVVTFLLGFPCTVFPRYFAVQVSRLQCITVFLKKFF